jgi:3-phenylpropionate/trans-cinnamate dioxygenase ferredoxin reductase subunit
MTHIAVIGAGLAGFTVSARLRALGYGGRITLFGAEGVPPYDRPPLSKKYLLGDVRLEQLHLRPQAFYEQHDIVLRLEEPVKETRGQIFRLRAGNTRAIRILF